MQKLVYSEKLKEVVRNVNYIEKVLQIIDRIEQVPFMVTTSEEKFIEVPYILEKIVEKIIVMPQIVEVLKYVHEVTEIESAGVAVDVEVGVHEARYKEITKSVDLQLGAVLRELKAVKADASLKKTIEVVEKFLLELRQFILVPRIVKIVEEKIVEKEVPVDRVVELHSQDEAAIRKELSLSILIEKLISELKRLKKSTGAGL